MCKFVQPRSEHLNFLNHLHQKYNNNLEDDYNQDTIAGLIQRVSPFFWVIITFPDKIPAGFVYLDNIKGNRSTIHSCEINTCFSPEFWGNYTKYCAKIFISNCFKKLRPTKIKALVYPQNHRVKAILESSGFKKEAELKSETLKNGKLQDIEIYSVYKKDYEVRNEN